MRLAFITQDFPPETGGIQTYSFEIAKNLHALCDYFLLIAPDKKNAADVDKALNYSVKRIKSRNTLLGLNLLNRLEKLVEDNEIDTVFHAQWQTLLPSLKLKQKGKISKVVAAAHAREFLFNPYENIPFLGKWYTNYRNKLIKEVDLFLPVSHYTKQILLDLGIEASKIKVVTNGTNPENFYPKNVDTLKQKLGLESSPVLFTVCRHVKRKGIATVLNAMPDILKDFPNLKYIIGGSGPETESLKQLTFALGIDKNVIFFTGRIPTADLNDYYNLCDIFVMTPLSILPDIEGFGIVYLEANACEKPTIGSESGGIPDAVIHNKTGLLVEEQNPKAIAEAVIKLLKNDELRHKLGKQGREIVENKANWRVICKEIYSLLQSPNS